MPYRLVLKRVIVPGLLLVTLIFSATTGLSQKPDGSTNSAAPTATPTAKTDYADGDEQVVVNSELISFDVTVTDKLGNCVGGLPESAFTVFDQKRPQEISFFGEDDSPASVGIVFDLTGSMTEDKAERARQALARFMETGHEEDDYYLVTLRSGHASLALDRTHDHEAVMDKLKGVTPRGNTAFYDGCYLALKKVLQGTHPRRALLIISDGQDNDSTYTFEELREALKESDVRIYSIGVAEKDNEYVRLYGEEILKDMADVTGGKYFWPRSSEEMYEAFDRIAVELRRQYAIGFRPSDFRADGKWHSLRVKLDRPPGQPRLFLRYRSGYYAQARER
jgi:Ca-activated chloride channel homolog